MELIGKKEFTTAVFDSEDKTFIIYMVSLTSSNIHLFYKIKIVLLKVDETPTIIFSEYSDFTDIFFPKLVVKLLKYTKINNYVINLIDDKQPYYRSIYSLGQVELETLKTYIKTNLANNFIKPSKSSIDILILFIWKSNSTFYLYVNYQDLNNLSIKN